MGWRDWCGAGDIVAAVGDGQACTVAPGTTASGELSSGIPCAQQVPLRAGDAEGLLDLALGSWPGIRRHAVRMTLRQTEQHKRQHDEKPRQDRSRPSHIVRRGAPHP